MNPEFEALGELMMQLGEKQLIEAIPVFSRMVSALVAKIRGAENYQSAETSFDLLRVLSIPLAKLSNVYNQELPPELKEVKSRGISLPRSKQPIQTVSRTVV